MNMKQTLLVAGALNAIVLSAPTVKARVEPLIFANLSGTVRIQQDVPCGDRVDETTTIAGGRMVITPFTTREGTLIDLTRLDAFLTPFSVQRECLGIRATADFSEIGIRLAGAVMFPAQETGAGQYRFTIPKEKFLLHESVADNAPVAQPETAFQRPSEDVTGEIDLRRRTVQLRVVLTAQLRFRAGCFHGRCVINEKADGTQTADVLAFSPPPGTDSDGDGVADLTDNCPLVPNATQAPVATPIVTAPPDVTLRSCRAHDIGEATATDVCHARPVRITNDAPMRFAIGPNVVTWFGNDGIDPIATARQTVTIEPPVEDTTPPTVSCTAVAPPGGSFQVRADDDCATPAIRLGSYALTNGEVIQIQRTGRPGVRLLETNRATGIRHFQVGRDEAFIVATDAAGNVARALCR
jgi:hypothetical protein